MYPQTCGNVFKVADSRRLLPAASPSLGTEMVCGGFPSSLPSTQNEVNSTMSRVNLKAAFGLWIQTRSETIFSSILIYCSVEDPARLALGRILTLFFSSREKHPYCEPSLQPTWSVMAPASGAHHTVTSCHGAEFVWLGPHSPSRHFLFAFTPSPFSTFLCRFGPPPTPLRKPKQQSCRANARGISDRQSDGTRAHGGICRAEQRGRRYGPQWGWGRSSGKQVLALHWRASAWRPCP